MTARVGARQAVFVLQLGGAQPDQFALKASA
jgi:hypothetical protein